MLHWTSRNPGGPRRASVGLCGAHHFHGVRRGWVCVWGRAPDQLVWELVGAGWELGERPEHVGPRC